MADKQAAAAAADSLSLEQVSFEQAMKELEAIVRRLEGGSSALEEAIQDYVRGTKLERHCRAQLDAAKLKIEAIAKHEAGAPVLQPFEQ